MRNYAAAVHRANHGRWEQTWKTLAWIGNVNFCGNILIVSLFLMFWFVLLLCSHLRTTDVKRFQDMSCGARFCVNLQRSCPQSSSDVHHFGCGTSIRLPDNNNNIWEAEVTNFLEIFHILEERIIPWRPKYGITTQFKQATWKWSSFTLWTTFTVIFVYRIDPGSFEIGCKGLLWSFLMPVQSVPLIQHNMPIPLQIFGYGWRNHGNRHYHTTFRWCPWSLQHRDKRCVRGVFAKFEKNNYILKKNGVKRPLKF